MPCRHRWIWAVTVWLVACAAFCSGGCSRREDEDDGQKRPLSPLATRSAFLNQLGKAKYPGAKGPEGPVLLRWDFSGDRVHEYDYRLDAKGAGLALGHRTRQKLGVDSELLVESRGNRAASIVRRNRILSMTPDSPGESDVAPATMEASAGPIHGVREDGSMAARLLERMRPGCLQ